MKNLRIPALCLCVLLLSVCSFAQSQTTPVREPDYNKPKLFTSLPDRIPVNIDRVNALLAVQVGAPASFSLDEATTKSFSGEVVSKANSSNNLQSVVIRSSNFPGATLTITKVVDKDGVATYTGRIISFQHSDSYELQNLEGRYMLVKKGFYDLINE